MANPSKFWKQIRRVDSGGKIHAFAGCLGCADGDGLPAIGARVTADKLAVSNNGTVYLGSQRGNGPVFGLRAVYEVAADGMLRRIALREGSDSSIFADGEIATRVGANRDKRMPVAVGPSGLHIAAFAMWGNPNNGPRVLPLLPHFRLR